LGRQTSFSTQAISLKLFVPSIDIWALQVRQKKVFIYNPPACNECLKTLKIGFKYSLLA
jgi:hypothetical protein